MKKYDVIVVGAGIVGLAHAYEASKKGKTVLVLEKNQFALSASVRNFGLVWPIGQPKGHLFDRAMKSRETWMELGSLSKTWFKENGSLHLVYHDDEWDVLNEFMDINLGLYDCELISPNVIQKKYPHIITEGLRGGLLSKTELTVNPYKAINQLATYLGSIENVTIQFGKAVTNISSGIVSTFDTQYCAENIIICSGSDFEILYPELLQTSGLEKVKLNMLRTKPLPKLDLGPSLCAGLTLRHYASFSDCPSLKRVSARYNLTDKDFEKWGVHLLVSQNDDHELVIGDSHEYGLDHMPFDNEDITTLIFDYLRTFLKIDHYAIKERWHGIYSKIPGKTELILKPEEGVTIVTGLSGAGMTLSFGLAQETISELLGEEVNY